MEESTDNSVLLYIYVLEQSSWVELGRLIGYSKKSSLHVKIAIIDDNVQSSDHWHCNIFMHILHQNTAISISDVLSFWLCDMLLHKTCSSKCILILMQYQSCQPENCIFRQKTFEKSQCHKEIRYILAHIGIFAVFIVCRRSGYSIEVYRLIINVNPRPMTQSYSWVLSGWSLIRGKQGEGNLDLYTIRNYRNSHKAVGEERFLIRTHYLFIVTKSKLAV